MEKINIIPVVRMYYNDTNNYGVYKVYTDENIEHGEITRVFDSSSDEYVDKTAITIAGKMQELTLGTEYECEAIYNFNKKFNQWQLQPEKIISKKPKTFEQSKMFLMSIITENQAKELLRVYPEIVNEVIENKDNVDTNKLKGIGAATYEKIRKKIINNYVISDILVMLEPIGVSYKTIKSMLLVEKNPILLKKKIEENPYILTSVRGLGFTKVDKFAVKLKPELKESKERLRAFVNYFLTEEGENSGNTIVDKGVLASAVKENVEECYKFLEELIKTESEEDSKFLKIDGRKIGLKRYYSTEKNIFNQLMLLKEEKTKIEEDVINKGIALAEKEQGFELTEEQKQIVKEAANESVVLISGKAGTGKTTIIRALMKIFKLEEYTVCGCALSAKAAQRIIEATGQGASTIHRLLKTDGFGNFVYNENNSLPVDVIFVDECSMISADLFWCLVRAVRQGGKIVMCGDNRQLPPIGYGNVFSDLLGLKEKFPVFTLEKVMRQAEKSGILSDANKIREGINPLNRPELKITTGELQDMTYMFRNEKEQLNAIAVKQYVQLAEKFGTDDIVIIVPRKSNCENSTSNINNQIQELLLPDIEEEIMFGEKKFKLGAKVIQRENDYEKNIFNGEIGYVSRIWEEENKTEKKKTKMFAVEYGAEDSLKEIIYSQNEMGQLDLAYALTIHLAQGSGYKFVIVAIDTSHYIMLDNCLLYTALTRAKERCLLLADPKAFHLCIAKNKMVSRKTWLKEGL